MYKPKFSPLPSKRILGGLVIAGLLVSRTPAYADIDQVDPGKTVSTGKPITGSGQNLPTLGATSTWNIGSLPAEYVNTYYTNGSALKDQSEVSVAARTWTKNWVQETCGTTKKSKVRSCKVVAVFDIDDTILSSYPTLSTNTPAFTYSFDTSNAAVAQCTQSVIEPVRNLYLALQRMGMSMVLLTGRPESQRADTTNCLNKAGINNWEELILKPAGDSNLASTYKAKARKSLTKQGWKIGPSIGDQVSDMSFGSLKHGFLIPNPMYLIP